MKDKLKSFFGGQWLLFVLLALVCFVWLGSDQLNLETKRFFYTLSLMVKSLIIFIIPIVIIAFISNSFASIASRAFLTIILIFGLVFLSNLIAIVYSYGFYSAFAVDLYKPDIDVAYMQEGLTTLWVVPQIKLLQNDTALLVGLFIGLYASFRKSSQVKLILEKSQALASKLLKYMVLPLLPLFIFGSLLNLEYSKVFDHIIATSDLVFVYFFIAQLLYIILLYLCASGFRYSLFTRYIKNIMPAYITGLSTMSSAATMPVTINATIKNTGNKEVTHTIIPAIVNIHLLGTAIGTNIIVLSTFALFSMPMPDFTTWLYYALYFAIAQFAVVGVSGGTVFSTIPIIEAHLGASPEMLALISTMIIMFDPIDTSFNVAGNGGFAILFNKLRKKGKFLLW